MNLNEETICGFLVTKQRKLIWQAELDMLKSFIKVCNDNGLKYFVSGGTLLGAIRHSGFIPWDDDIDVMMPRDDYEKFLKIGQKSLPDNLFLQSYLTEKKYVTGHAQIRNSSTTCFLSTGYYDLKLGKNCGVFIDIFPYDYTKNKMSIRTRAVSFLKGIASARVYSNKKYSLKFRIIIALSKVFFTTERLIRKIDKISKSCKSKKYVGLVSFMPGLMGNVWKKEYFDEVDYCDFHDIKVAIPKDYDSVLKTEYGDYMIIPDNKNGTLHGSCFFDLKNPYTKYRELTESTYQKLFDNIEY